MRTVRLASMALVPAAFFLLAGCGEKEEDDRPVLQTEVVDDGDVATDCETGGRELGPPISDEELADLKRDYEEGRAAEADAEAQAVASQAEADETELERC